MLKNVMKCLAAMLVLSLGVPGALADEVQTKKVVYVEQAYDIDSDPQTSDLAVSAKPLINTWSDGIGNLYFNDAKGCIQMLAPVEEPATNLNICKNMELLFPAFYGELQNKTSSSTLTGKPGKTFVELELSAPTTTTTASVYIKCKNASNSAFNYVRMDYSSEGKWIKLSMTSVESGGSFGTEKQFRGFDLTKKTKFTFAFTTNSDGGSLDSVSVDGEPLALDPITTAIGSNGVASIVFNFNGFSSSTGSTVQKGDELFSIYGFKVWQELPESDMVDMTNSLDMALSETAVNATAQYYHENDAAMDAQMIIAEYTDDVLENINIKPYTLRPYNLYTGLNHSMSSTPGKDYKTFLWSKAIEPMINTAAISDNP